MAVKQKIPQYSLFAGDQTFNGLYRGTVIFMRQCTAMLIMYGHLANFNP